MPNIILNDSSYLVLSVRTLINVRFSILWVGVNRVALVDHISSLSLLFPLGLGMDFGICSRPAASHRTLKTNREMWVPPPVFLLVQRQNTGFWLDNRVSSARCCIFTWISIHFKHVNCEFVPTELELAGIESHQSGQQTMGNKSLHIKNKYFWASPHTSYKEQASCGLRNPSYCLFPTAYHLSSQ